MHYFVELNIKQKKMAINLKKSFLKSLLYS